MSELITTNLANINELAHSLVKSLFWPLCLDLFISSSCMVGELGLVGSLVGVEKTCFAYDLWLPKSCWLIIMTGIRNIPFASVRINYIIWNYH